MTNISSILKSDKFNKMLSLIIMGIFAFQLSGCGKGGDGLKCYDGNNNEVPCSNEYEEPDDFPDDDFPDDDDIDDDYIYEDILENELVIDSVPLGLLKPNSELHFKIEGVEEFPKFTGNTIKVFNSSWEEKVCIPGGLGGSGNNNECFWFPKKGTCTHRFNNKKENGLIALSFSDDIEHLRLKLKIKGVLYSLGEIQKVSKTTIKTKLILDESILTQAEEGELIVAKYKETQHQVGFFGFISCEGLGKKGFKTEGPTSSEIIKVRREQRFNVSLRVIYR